jgi:DNA-binding SARP family transcriptional activator/predicted negative regulator of RcsB-dependent stress response
VAIVVQLLGPPLITREGVVYAAPRGRKVWAVLAYLALARQPPTRHHLIDLLFPEAEDPASTLRWNLSELRRLLGGPDTVGSANVVRLKLPEGSVIDVDVLQEGTSGAAVELPGLGRELLEGVDVEASPGFSAWILGERRRLQSLSGAVLREGALRALAADDPVRAIELATRLVGAEPLSEDAHVLLVRAFAATGDEEAVERQLTASIDLFRRELGSELAPELYEAARMETRPATAPAASSAPGVHALLESGGAAVDAGAVDVGIAGLRDAVHAARAADEPQLEAAALVALGTALVHAAKGRDEEGSAALHRAIMVADRAGVRPLAAAAHRELGYVEYLRGEYPRGTLLLRAASDLARDDPVERARIQVVVGIGWSDVGSHARATEAFGEAIDLAERAGDRRLLAWALACHGRTLVERDDLDAAEEELARASELSRAERWTAFLPFPEALLAEVWIRRGRCDRASQALDHAFALGCAVNDACWEAYAVRGLGLLQAAGGDRAGATARLEDALIRCTRQRDTHRWIRAHTLDALCAVGLADGDARTSAWVADLAALAGRSGMRELSARAYLHRWRLGDASAIEGARAIAVEVDNPALSPLMEDPRASPLELLLGLAASDRGR